MPRYRPSHCLEERRKNTATQGSSLRNTPFKESKAVKPIAIALSIMSINRLTITYISLGSARLLTLPIYILLVVAWGSILQSRQ